MTTQAQSLLTVRFFLFGMALVGLGSNTGPSWLVWVGIAALGYPAALALRSTSRSAISTAFRTGIKYVGLGLLAFAVFYFGAFLINTDIWALAIPGRLVFLSGLALGTFVAGRLLFSLTAPVAARALRVARAEAERVFEQLQIAVRFYREEALAVLRTQD